MAAFPAYTGSDVMTLAAGFLNDAGRSLFTDTVMFPYVQSAIERLQNELISNGVQFTSTKAITTTIPAGTFALPLATIQGYTGAAAFVEPIELLERPAGNTSVSRVPMTERGYEPEFTTPQDNLGYWAWREQILYFPNDGTTGGASQGIDLEIRFTAGNLYIAAKANPIGILQGKEFLAYKTAEMVARYVGENTERADQLKMEAEGPNGDGGALAILIQTMVNNMQGVKTRRRPFAANPYYRRG